MKKLTRAYLFQIAREKSCDYVLIIYMKKLRICSCLACRYRVMDARRKFGEHEKCVRVARGGAESNSCFLSALQTSQVHPQLDYAQLKA